MVLFLEMVTNINLNIGYKMDLITGVYYIALCIYHEALNEPVEGQILVAQSIFNRSEQRQKSVKEIIYEPSQYSWTQDGKSDKVVAHERFIGCFRAVFLCLIERFKGNTEHGLNLYHAEYVHPYWADSPKVTFLRKVGKHLFYKE